MGFDLRRHDVAAAGVLYYVGRHVGNQEGRTEVSRRSEQHSAAIRHEVENMEEGSVGSPKAGEGGTDVLREMLHKRHLGKLLVGYE